MVRQRKSQLTTADDGPSKESIRAQKKGRRPTVRESKIVLRHLSQRADDFLELREDPLRGHEV
jgi:hypothetical protein